MEWLFEPTVKISPLGNALGHISMGMVIVYSVRSIYRDIRGMKTGDGLLRYSARIVEKILTSRQMKENQVIIVEPDGSLFVTDKKSKKM